MYLKLIEHTGAIPEKPGVYWNTSTKQLTIKGTGAEQSTAYPYGTMLTVMDAALADARADFDKAHLEGKLEGIKEANAPEITNVDVTRGMPEESLNMSNILKLIAVAQKPELAFGKEKK